MTQNEKVLEYMRKHGGKITQLEAINHLGCLRLSARIADLKVEGYRIWTELKTVENRDGTKSRIGVYHLRETEQK